MTCAATCRVQVRAVLDRHEADARAATIEARLADAGLLLDELVEVRACLIT